MPNNCQCTININNLTSEQVKRVVAAAEGQALLAEFFPEPDYTTTPVALEFPQIPAQFAKTDEERATLLANKPVIREDGWYHWRNQNWGCKWDIFDVVVNQEPNSVSVICSTAWAPPSEGWVEALIGVMPNAEVALTYHEPGCDFAGVIKGSRDGVTNASFAPSALYEEWVKKTQSPETQAILNDSDHEQYDEVDETVREAWYEVEADLIDAAIDKL